MSYIGPQKVFSHLDRLAGWQAGHRPAPVTVELDLCNRCSLGCQSCHFAHTHVAGPWAAKATKPLSYEETGVLANLDVTLRALSDMRTCGVEGLVLSGGGEPTLHPKFDEIVDAAMAHGFALGMYTLGGHLPAERAERVKWAFTWVVVSLDCPDGETYAAEKGVPASRFEEACAGIRRISGGPAVVGVSFLLHAENWMRTAEMLALARSLGASYATFRPTIETEPGDFSAIAGSRAWVTDALPTLEALADEPDVEVDPARFVQYRDWTGHTYQACYGIRMVTQITPDGRVWVCPNRRGLTGSELGDLRTESFAAIWQRHPGQWTDFKQCRAMCRLNAVNTVLAPVFSSRKHEAFV